MKYTNQKIIKNTVHKLKLYTNNTLYTTPSTAENKQPFVNLHQIIDSNIAMQLKDFNLFSATSIKTTFEYLNNV